MKLKVRMNGKAKGRKLFVCLVAASFAIALALAGTAGAVVNWQFSFGTSGSGAGQFNQPAGIAINQGTGDVYVADRLNERVQEFTSAGSFVRAWGVDVVASGEDNKPAADEVQNVRIKAATGTFALTFGAATSAFVSNEATPLELQTALNATSTISAGGGSVSVSEGGGSVAGNRLYLVTFNGGPLAGKDVSQLVINQSDLGIAVGTQLNCSQESVESPKIAYRWIANGATIPGAESASYTVAAPDAGKVVQCVVLATWGEDTLLEAGVPFHVVTPAPTPAPPIPPPVASLFNVFGTGSRAVGTPGGSTLNCEANTWTQGPTEYTYRMFRNGQEVGSPFTTTATSHEYVFTTADLSSPADFQCGVTGKNAGGGEAIFFSRDARTEPAPPGCCHVFNRQVVTVAANGAGTGVTSQNGGPAFEVCKANPPSTDVCKAGVRGDALGQFNRPRGVAVDQATGAVYVGDDRNFRVQKFTATGTPILTIGKQVNKSTGGGICTVASGDACGTGLQSLDETSGTFGGWPTGGAESPEGGSQENDFKELGNSVAVDGSGNVYVTDPYLCCGSHRTRIQKFDSSGNFLGQVFTNGVTSEAKPLSIAADAAGHVFTAVGGEQTDVVVSEPPDFTLEGTEQTFVERYVLHENEDPVQVAAEPIDPKVWIMDRNRDAFNGPSRHVCKEAGNTSRRALLSYDLEGHRLDCTVPLGEGELGQVSGLASSSTRLFVSNKSLNQVKVFSLPPDIAPAVGTESVSRITTETAKIGAEINPGYEPTSYVVEYGLGDCEVSVCASVPGATDVYGANYVSVEIPIKELEPNTRYHYRIVAENSKGPGVGVDRTFVTYPFVDLVNDPCPNALARKQTRTSGALDCRADELASASFTGGYDVTSDLVPGLTPFDGYPDAPGKLLYSVRDGGIPGTGSPTNRGPDPYLATRSDEGWTTKYVGIPADGGFSEAPFSSTLDGVDSGLDTFAFAGPEICSPCFADGSTGIPVRFPDGTLAQGMHGQFDQGASAKSDGLVRKRLSADGTHFVFGSLLRYQPDGNNNTGDVSIYDRNLSTGVTQVVSKSPAGANLTCLQGAGTCHSPGNTAGIAELGLSNDGSRIVVAQRISTDTAGNHYWHPYMHRGTSSNTVDLAPGTTTGALFDGMTEDGSKVFLTTKDKLLAADEDTSADVYLAEVGSSGPATLKLLSAPAPAPAPGNVDTCNPPGEPNNWNTVSGAGKCNVVALAGGAGVAGGDGTFYFLSPELLDGPSNGLVNQPNLYVVRPGPTAPHFVATLDDSTIKPPPPPKPPPEHPAVGNVISGLSTPEALAVDQSSGDIYVAERGASRVSRYTAAGAPDNFSALGTNKITGQSLGGAGEGQIAIDNAPGSPLQGDIYITTNGGSVSVYAPTGTKLGELTGFGEACGVAVNESNGVVYVGDYSSPGMWRFVPKAGPPLVAVSNADFEPKTGLKTASIEPCNIGADSAGQVYATNWNTGPTQYFLASHFAVAPPSEVGGELPLGTTNIVNTDPATNDVYADTGAKIVQFDSSHSLVAEFGSGSMPNSRGVAVNGTTKHAYASTGSTVVEFGFNVPPYEPPPLIDDPAVVHALQGNETRRYSDFQTTPDGHYGLFSTKLLLNPEYNNAGHRMVYRYDAVGDEIACASCLPTEGTPRGDAGLPSHGLGITDAGGVFFNSTDPLVMRDTNEKLDAYEWENGAFSLISTGFSSFPSSLLTVTADGKDAFFFTRETLVPSDNNGQAMKIYDAREGGGFFVIPESPPCAASDECHGPGTQAAPPPSIGTFKGTGGQHNQVKCKKGFVLKHGRCVRKRKHHRRHHKHRHSHRRRAATGQGSSR